MSGSLGLQGRYATSFGYGPRLGVGRYPAFERGALSNALLQAAGDYGYGQPPGNGGGTAVNEDIVRAPELLAPVSQAAAPQAIPLPGLEPISGQALDAGGGGGNGLLQYLPAALGIAAPYLLKKLLGDSAASGLTINPADYPTTLSVDQMQSVLDNMQAQQPTDNGVGDMQSVPENAYVTMASFGVPNPTLSLPQMQSVLDNVAATPLPDSGIGGIHSVPENLYVNASDAAMAGGGDFWGGAGTDAAGGFGAPDLGGSGLDLGSLDWSINAPGTGAFGADLNVGPLTINPLGVAAGALGSWGGGKLASGLVQGDEQQGWASNIGGAVGGFGGGALASALAGSAFGPVGTLIGAFLGSLAGGTLGAGEPDYPYGYVGANVGYGDNGPQLNFWTPNGQNGGDAGKLGNLSNALSGYINNRAQQEGYVVNPEFINRGAFSAGFTDAPGGGKYFVGGSSVSPSQAAYDNMSSWRGDSLSALPDQVYQNLVGSNVLARPGTFTPWQDVWSQVSQPQAITSGGEAGDFVTGYTTPDQNQWFAPAPVDNSWVPQGSTAQPAYDPGMYDQIGAGG